MVHGSISASNVAKELQTSGMNDLCEWWLVGASANLFIRNEEFRESYTEILIDKELRLRQSYTEILIDNLTWLILILSQHLIQLTG